MFVLNANNGKSLPRVLNQGDNFLTAYPNVNFQGYFAAPTGANALYWTVNTDVTKGIADHTIFETVGSTQINWYFRTLIDIFEVAGNFYANADYWTQTEMTIWYTGFAYNALTAATRNFSDTARFASFETLPAWKVVGATCQFAPAFKLICNGPNPANLTWSNLVATLVFKLMRADGTLVTIGTMTTSAAAWTSANGSAWYAFGPLKTSTFTPQTTQNGDRIVIEATLTGSVTIPSWTGWGGWGAWTLTMSLGFGFEGSRRQIMLDYSAARPVQISIT